jgi:hypothetical protein
MKYLNSMICLTLLAAALITPCYGAQAGAGDQDVLRQRFLALASRLPTPEALATPVCTGWQSLGTAVLAQGIVRGFTAEDVGFTTNPAGFADAILEVLLPFYTKLPWYSWLKTAYQDENCEFARWILVHGYNCLGSLFYDEVLWPKIGSIDITSPTSKPQQTILAICLSGDEQSEGRYFEDYRRQGRVEKGPDYYSLDRVIGNISDAECKGWSVKRAAFFAKHPDLPNSLIDPAPARR